MLEIKDFKTPNIEVDYLSFKPGTITAIYGENGCGKTTFAKYLAGYYHDYEGTIIYQNNEQKQINPDIALLLQNPYHQFVGQTVFDEVTYYLEQLNFSAELISQKLTKLSFSPTQLLKELSGGMAQQLLIETFLLGCKTIYICDETFSNLDYQQKTTIIKKLKAENKTVIYITNNYYDLKMADVVYELKDKCLTKKNLVFNNSQQLINKSPVILEVMNDNKHLQFRTGFNILTGPSGCGKTTFVEQLIGLQKSKLKVNNQQLKYSYVSQYPFSQIITVNAEQLFKNNEQINQLLNVFELPKTILKREIVSLSTGELTQLMIIKALIDPSEIVVLDESLEVLDYQKQKIVFDMCKNSKKSFIFITHNHLIYQEYEINEVKLCKL